MKRLVTLTAALTAALSLVAVALGANPKLTAVVGPGTNITLKQATKKVTSLKAGKYTIVVQDKSNAHNFHLTGPGVNKTTTVAQVATKTWTVTFKKGTYKFVCDPHRTFMKGSFTVK